MPLKALAARTLTTIGGGAGAGYAAGHPMVGAIAGLALGIMDTPKVKAALAIVLDRAGKVSRKISGPVTKGIVAGGLPYGMNRPENVPEAEPIQSQPEPVSVTPSPQPQPEETRVLDGITYKRINGKWMQ